MRRPLGVDLVVVITDNDVDRSAEPVVEAARATTGLDIRYVVEPRRGIPFARNTGVRAAGDVDWVAFVDDDEVVDETWLERLLTVAAQTGADVVTGTVLPHFDERPPSWVVRGGFFERPRFATGTAIPYARTSNALVAGRLLRGEGDGPFSERLLANGGDDTHFFQRVRLAGGRIVWADEAVVTETVPTSRVDVRWLVKREYRRGNTLSWCLRDLEDSWPRRGKRAVAGLVRCVQGIGLILASVVRGKAARVQGLRRLAFGAGLLTGLTGHAYQEYRTVHGR
jgi:succinoglycan biosynthesis protein ExoM